MKAISDHYDAVQSIAPGAKTSTATGTGVDLANVTENFFGVFCGTRTDGTHTPKLQDSADNSTFADVAAADQVGTFAAIASNVSQLVSYIGSKQYVRVVSTVSGATTGAVYGAYALVKYRKQP